jgi:hypothetical protein
MSLYSALGQLQMGQGRYLEAAKTYMAYPGLKDRDANTVGLSNYLYPAAMSLLECGASAEARQLLSTVAQYQDGSYSNLGGVISLALMDGRYELAREVLQNQYGRYHNANSAGKLISLQFMMGNSQEAWSAIKQEARASRLWPSIVGLRMGNADPARIAQWSAEDADLVNNYGEPASIMFNAMSIDRPAESIRSIYEVDVQARAATKTFKMKEPTLKEIKAGAKADGFLSYPALIDGYAAFKERDYAQAVAALKSIYENSESGSASHRGAWHASFLPHYAFAAAKAGKGDDATAIDQRLRAPSADAKSKAASSEGAVPDFEHHLILAIAHAFNEHHAEAVSEVQLARASLAGTDLFDSGYIFVEILERLSDETRQPGYLAVALDYSRAHERMKPWASWAYAFEAKHAAPGPARVRAAGIALKLDPQSLWLQEMDKQTMAQARQWAAHNRWPGKDAPNASAKWNRT